MSFTIGAASGWADATKASGLQRAVVARLIAGVERGVRPVTSSPSAIASASAATMYRCAQPPKQTLERRHCAASCPLACDVHAAACVTDLHCETWPLAPGPERSARQTTRKALRLTGCAACVRRAEEEEIAEELIGEGEGEGGEAEDEVHCSLATCVQEPCCPGDACLTVPPCAQQELEAMKTRVKEMEDEAEQLRKIQEQVEEKGGSEAPEAAADETDSRSICVQQVDYSATPEELQEFFAGCGTVNRVTILCGPGGQPKGYAYIEFAEVEAVDAAVALHESDFKGRTLKISAKRTNIAGFGKGKKGKGKGKGKKGKGKGKGKGGYGAWYKPRSGKGKGYSPY